MKKVFITLILFPLSLLSMQPSGLFSQVVSDSGPDGGDPRVLVLHIPQPKRSTDANPSADICSRPIVQNDDTALDQAINKGDVNAVNTLLQHRSITVKTVLDNLRKNPSGGGSKENRLAIIHELDRFQEFFDEANTTPSLKTLASILEFGFLGLIGDKVVRLGLSGNMTKDDEEFIERTARKRYATDSREYQMIQCYFLGLPRSK